MYDGYVVCEEFADLVMDAWNQEQENKVGMREPLKCNIFCVARYRLPVPYIF